MPTYILLMQLTEQGIKDIKNAPSGLNKRSKALKPWEAR